MKKRNRKKGLLSKALSIALTASLAMNVLSAAGATIEEINQSSVFLKQPTGSNICTLVSATMLVRRAAMLNGYEGWADVTTDVMRSAAWETGVGLKWKFNCVSIYVAHDTFSGKAEDLASLLSAHPEGIVIYDRAKPHAILVTDYTDGVFYCADPSPAAEPGRIPISSATVTVEGADDIWYVDSPSLNLTDENGNILSKETLPPGIITGSSPSPSPGVSPTASASPKPAASAEPKETKKPAAKKVTAPKKVSGVKVKNKAKKSVHVSWKKVISAKGYEILYADNVRFHKYGYVYSQKKQHRLENLTKGKSYYVKVRAYKSDGEELVYGKWSGVKKAKVKK